MKWLFFLLIPALLLAQNTVLFSLKRTTNTNEIIYELNHEDCTPNGKNPIHPYWIMHEKEGKKEELTAMERKRVYGVVVKTITPSSVTFSLKAVSDRTITTKCLDGKPIALLALNGKNCILKSVFVKTKGGGLIPKVESITLRGYESVSNENVEEVIQK